MPLFLHERDARQRFCDILATVRKSVPAVLHCFTGIREDLKTYLNMGLHIGITGWICDERRGMHLRELVKDIPLDRVASASVRDGISAAAVVFAPDYGSEDDHQIRPHLFSRDCAGSTSPDSLAPAA